MILVFIYYIYGIIFLENDKGSGRMDYKVLIIKLVSKLKDEDMLRRIYFFIKNQM